MFNYRLSCDLRVASGWLWELLFHLALRVGAFVFLRSNIKQTKPTLSSPSRIALFPRKINSSLHILPKEVARMNEMRDERNERFFIKLIRAKCWAAFADIITSPRAHWVEARGRDNFGLSEFSLPFDVSQLFAFIHYDFRISPRFFHPITQLRNLTRRDLKSNDFGSGKKHYAPSTPRLNRYLANFPFINSDRSHMT